MEDKSIDYRAFLLFALNHFGIEVVSETKRRIKLVHDYEIELEGPALFKLIHQGQVIGPFGEVEQLCEFIHQDIQLNYG